MEVSELKEKLFNYIDENSDELLNMCSDLIKFPTENPIVDTTEITKYIQNYLKDAGIESKTYESNDKMFNIIASTGSDEDDAKNLILCGHTDVVPAGNRENWDFDPFSGEIKEGWLLGRGASDMKAGLGGIIFAVATLGRLNVKLPGNVTLAIVPDEETGGEYGVPWLLKNELINGDGCLIAEPSSPQNPTIGQKGSYWFKLTTYGQPGHGSLSPVAGGNAIDDMMIALNKIKSLWDMSIPIPNEVENLLYSSKKYMNEVEKERKEYYPVLENVTVNIGKIVGGTKSNVIPERCSAEIDCRLPFGVTQEQVTSKIEKLLSTTGIKYSIERFGFKSNANFTSEEDPICKSTVNNIEAITKKESYGVMQWASSDARHFRDYNIPVLQYGPAHLSTIHGYNERVKTEQIITSCKVYIGTIIDFLYSNY